MTFSAESRIKNYRIVSEAVDCGTSVPS